MSIIINLTPHPVVVVDDDWSKTFPPSGTVARISTEEITTHCIIVHGPTCPVLHPDHGDETDCELDPEIGCASIPIIRQTYGEVEHLPGQCKDTYYIVSAMVRIGCPNRTDLLSPGQLIRDDDGRVIGCKGLIR